jgi:hypothetical protein
MSSTTIPSHVEVTCDACKKKYTTDQRGPFGIKLEDKAGAKHYKKWYVLSIGQYLTLEFDLCEPCCQQVYMAVSMKMKQLKETVIMTAETM